MNVWGADTNRCVGVVLLAKKCLLNTRRHTHPIAQYPAIVLQCPTREMYFCHYYCPHQPLNIVQLCCVSCGIGVILVCSGSVSLGKCSPIAPCQCVPIIEDAITYDVGLFCQSGIEPGTLVSHHVDKVTCPILRSIGRLVRDHMTNTG